MPPYSSKVFWFFFSKKNSSSYLPPDGIPRRHLVRALSLILIAGALIATAAMVAWWGAAAIGHAVWRAMPSLPGALFVHGVQLVLSGLAWWCLLRPRSAPGAVVFARWVREAVNTLLPLAGISGAVAATRLLARQNDLSMAEATASTTADITCEAVAQAPYLLVTLAVAAMLAPGAITPGRAALAVGPLVVGVVGFIVAQRAGAMRLLERAARMLGFPQALAGLHEGLMALHARPTEIAASVATHFLSWSLGGAEVWVILHAIGDPVGAGAAFAIEGVGMAARSMGFALPSGLAAQEAGFVLGAGMFGIAAPDAVALSMLKRVRELIVSVAGVAAWQAALWRR